MFVYFLSRALNRVPCAMHALTMMSNHVHLLMTPYDADDLSQFVKSLAQRYAQRRNNKKGASGKLFEQRFFSRPVLSELQVAIVISYIHANPVRAGLVDNALDHQWSTHALHALAPVRCRISADLWTPIDWYLALSDNEAVRGERYLAAYDDFRRHEAKPEHVSDLEILEMISEGKDLWVRRPDGTRAVELPEEVEKKRKRYRKLRA